MTVTVSIESNNVIGAMMDAVGPEGRHQLLSVAANAVRNACQEHVRSYAQSKHLTAHRLGAQPTGHYEKGSAAISWSADSESGTVTIPIPGISRAFGDVRVSPRRGKALTIPISDVAYGRTVAEVRALGWTVFRPKGKDYLMGSDESGNVKPMFRLVGGVVLRQDPTLLPSMDDNAGTAAKAMLNEIRRCVEKARGRDA